MTKLIFPRNLPLLPKQSERQIGKKTLLLDLDNTLVYSSIYDSHGYDFEVSIDDKRGMYVKKRPGLDAFLVDMSKIFELVIFTSSPACYANQVIDKIDPAHQFISHRLFIDSCTELWHEEDEEGLYVKDLSVLGRSLKDSILVDDCTDNFCVNPNNGIAVKPFYVDDTDGELVKLGVLLQRIARCRDVRHVLGARRVAARPCRDEAHRSLAKV